MTNQPHPKEVLFGGEKLFPALSTCEHFAGSEKLIFKAYDFQAQLGPIFDITCDCEDGAQSGRELEHAEMVGRSISSSANKYRKAGVRIHDPAHPSWKQDVEVVLSLAAKNLAYVTIPKATSVSQVAGVIDYVQAMAAKLGSKRQIPIHVLIETHGALRDVWSIAGLGQLEVLDFGLMDFVSAHHGAIPAKDMRSPGQFEHKLLVRAKSEMVAAALANGVVPAHNVCMNLKDPAVITADATRARVEFGFQRMWSIYPAQITPIVNAMQPKFDEVTDAGEIILSAQKNSWGPIQHKGELHDRATYRYYWVILERAKAGGMKLPDEVEETFFNHSVQ